MKRLITVFVFLVLFLNAPLIYSKPEVIILQLPPSRQLALPEGEFRCYDLEAMKTLRQLAIDFTICAEQDKRYISLTKDYDLKVGNLEKQLASSARINEIVKMDRDRLFEKWKKENKLRHEAENTIHWTTWLSWGAAGTTTVVSVVLAALLISK